MSLARVVAKRSVKYTDFNTIIDTEVPESRREWASIVSVVRVELF
jgi:hypothetical protein